ncbi:MAG: aminotransferase class I/II-fold pyridoxal phosphate-dependent enzyme [Schleiferiaceae bacterium]|nr:aminotransferase class I/II-fold pyridoxal phosphate-dependent enzyme [Schleiferiaceae bacterium]
MDFSATLRSKLPRVGTTIFTKMSALAKAHGAINLSQGFPDFDPDPKLLEAVQEGLQGGHNQYAPMAGNLHLRQLLASEFQSMHGAAFDPEREITITAGATQAISTAIHTIVREEDEVIIFTPAYDCYAPIVELVGAKPVYVQLTYPDYSVPWDLVVKLINHRTRMLIINTPHNPSGTTLKPEDFERLQRIITGSNIIVLSDEVYRHIVFGGAPLSVANYPELAKQSIIVGSFGKTFHVTGWKVGYALAPAEMMEEFRKVHQYQVFSVNSAAQFGLAKHMQTTQLHQLPAFFEAKRNFFLEQLAGSRFKVLPSSGGYFQLLDYSAISSENDIDFAERLTKEHGVASIPMSVFYHADPDHKVLRFCFAKKESTLAAAAKKLLAV